MTKRELDKMRVSIDGRAAVISGLTRYQKALSLGTVDGDGKWKEGDAASFVMSELASHGLKVTRRKA